MAKESRSSSNKPKNGSFYEKWEFIDLPIDASDMQAIRTNELDVPFIFDSIEQMCALGYKFSLGYDDKSDCLIFSVTGTKERCPNFGYTVVSRAVTFYRCLQVFFYKHEKYVDAQGKWPRSPKESGGDFMS